MATHASNQDEMYRRVVEWTRTQTTISGAKLRAAPLMKPGMSLSYNGAQEFIERMVGEGVIGPNQDGEHEVLPPQP